MGKKYYLFFTVACTFSLLLGLGLGYLLFGGVTVNATSYNGALAQAPATKTYHDPALGANDEAPPADGNLYFNPDTETPHRYVVTVYGGYVTVYYAGGGVKEITTTPVNALPLTDKEALEDGIRIYTDEALARLLQDYGS